MAAPLWETPQQIIFCGRAILQDIRRRQPGNVSVKEEACHSSKAYSFWGVLPSIKNGPTIAGRLIHAEVVDLEY